MLKKATQFVLVAVLATAVSSCNKEDVVNGVIIGGIIGGIVAGGDVSVGVPTPGYTYLSDCEGYRREWICEWDGGSWHRSERRYRRPFNNNFNNVTESLAFVTDAQSDATAVDQKSVLIEKRWNLNESSAVKLSNAIENAKGGDMNAFSSIGLDLQDMATLLNKSQIDVNNLDKVAASLQTSSNNALDILTQFVHEYNSQKTDVKSALWSQCVAKGKWKTPEATSCSSLDAQGCAPALGASNCLPL